jgi:hypothetical protein
VIIEVEAETVPQIHIWIGFGVTGARVMLGGGEQKYVVEAMQGLCCASADVADNMQTPTPKRYFLIVSFV